MQGSNIIDGIRSKLIKEDHFIACTTRMFETHRRRTGPKPAPPGFLRHGRLCTPKHCRTKHILAASDYSLVKEHFCKRRWQLSLPSSCLPRHRGAESYRRFRCCQSGVENFFRTLKRPIHRVNLKECCLKATGGSKPLFAAVCSQRLAPCRRQVTHNEGYYANPSFACQHQPFVANSSCCGHQVYALKPLGFIMGSSLFRLGAAAGIE
jgi:hypothetical protein